MSGKSKHIPDSIQVMVDAYNLSGPESRRDMRLMEGLADHLDRQGRALKEKADNTIIMDAEDAYKKHNLQLQAKVYMKNAKLILNILERLNT